jgi:hypothetical protein
MPQYLPSMEVEMLPHHGFDWIAWCQIPQNEGDESDTKHNKEQSNETLDEKLEHNTILCYWTK